MVFSTTDNWSREAERLLDNPTKPGQPSPRAGSPGTTHIDWSSFVVVEPEETMQDDGPQAGLTRISGRRSSAVIERGSRKA